MNRMWNKTLSELLVIGCCVTAVSDALAIDGTNLPTKYAGYLIASQGNATGFGDGFTGTVTDFSIGSEFDALYVTSDASNLWIGITGNLPNKLASGQSAVILLQVNDPPFIPDPNTL